MTRPIARFGGILMFLGNIIDHFEWVEKGQKTLIEIHFLTGINKNEIRIF